MRVSVIGGGAAGMLAAIAAAENGHTVTLFEKNEKLGKKIYITGKGRCNCTNGIPVEDFPSHYISNPRFLYSALYAFTNKDLMRLLEDAGTPLKTERGNRVFPVSDHASDVTRALEQCLKKNHVVIRLNTPVKELLTEDADPVPVEPKPAECKNKTPSPDSGQRICGIWLADGMFVPSDAVIVCTGGISYPSTGSTGDGYRFAVKEGLKVTDLRPSLVPLTVEEPDIPSLEGLSLRNVTLTVLCGRKKKYSELGEMMFTRSGITGPLALKASALCGKELEKQGTLSAEIDLKPALSPEQLDQRLLREFQKAENKNLHTVMGTLLPARMIPVILDRAGIPGNRKIHDITREERSRILQGLKHFCLTISGTGGFNQAVVTQGGISVKEINPGTMEAKKVHGLYFAGEVLDVDGFTGGFNLQAAFSTGFLAGDSVGRDRG